MGKVLTVKNLRIGEGQPKIIVPIVERTYAGIIAKAQSIEYKAVDMAEWRADFYDDTFDTGRVLQTLSDLRRALGDRPLIFTFRSRREGGKQDIDMAAYSALNQAVAQSGQADLIDVEMFCDEQCARQNIVNIHDAGVLAVGSYHDFSATPPAEEILSRLQKMRHMGADMVKIAVMPTCSADVLTLLSAAVMAREQQLDCPLIAISMSARGLLSRLAGELYGSAATFGAMGQISAPGQISAEKLAQVLKILHEAM